MARKRTTTDDTDKQEPVFEGEPVVGLTPAAAAEQAQAAEAAAEAERERLAAEAVQGGAGPGETGPLG